MPVPTRLPLAPAHPHLRREPLPGHQPKPAEEDPDAPRRVQAIVASASYRRADRDVDFLNQDETRGVRLQIDYQKAQQLLEQHGIEHTIVVFGRTRICEPAAAQRRVEALLAELKARPGDAAPARGLGVAERVLAKSYYYDTARELGWLVGGAGAGPQDNRVVVMTGGGPGIVEAASRGAYDVGAKNVGLTSLCRTSSFPTPTSRRICASASIISPCASCTFCCAHAPWWPSPAATALSTSCSRPSP